MNKSSGKSLPVIGPSVLVSVGNAEGIPAKIDTGAEFSSVWASNIKIGEDNELRFSLFGKSSKFYTGKVYFRKDYKAIAARTATGHESVRYLVRLPLKIEGQTIRALFTLSDRGKNNFPILIGRHTLAGKFLVDPAAPKISPEKKKPLQKIDHATLSKNPKEFHQKYMKGDK